MIEETYVSFDTAKLLKEKGFNEECQGYFEVPNTSFPFSNKQKTRKVLNVLPKDWNSHLKECVTYEHISIPTQQMAMKWLREVHNLHVDVDPSEGNWNPTILELENWSSVVEDETGLTIYDSYEEAVEEALKYSLKNLI